MIQRLEVDLAIPARGSRQRIRSIHRQLRQAIIDARLKPGARLPSTRAFASEHGLARNTACAVYDLLLAEGYLVARAGSGVFVAGIGPKRAQPAGRSSARVDHHLRRQAERFSSLRLPDIAPPSRIDMRLGIPDQSLFPFDVWRRMVGQALRELARIPGSYADTGVDRRLREAIAAHVSYSRAIASDASEIVACNGAQQAFDLLARVLVRPGKTCVAVEDPGYLPLCRVFAGAGARVAPVPVDEEGIIVDRIPREARLICVTPSHQFPLGVAMSARRRRALLEFAGRAGAVIVEDDYDSEFRHGARPLDALRTLDGGELVVYVGTFSKSMFPALRLGFLLCPAWLRPALAAARAISAWHGRPVEEAALTAFISGGHLARHIRKMRRVYSGRRTALLAALRTHAGGWLKPTACHAGLHITALAAGERKLGRLVERAHARGVAIDRIGRFATLPLKADGLALGFGACPERRIEEAVLTLLACASGLSRRAATLGRYGR